MTNTDVNPAAAALRGLPSVPPERRLLFRLRVPLQMSSARVAGFSARPGSLVVADSRECAGCSLSGMPVRVYLVSPSRPRVAGWVPLSSLVLVPADEPVAL